MKLRLTAQPLGLVATALAARLYAMCRSGTKVVIEQ